MSFSLPTAKDSDICMRLLWEHNAVLRTDDYYKECTGRHHIGMHDQPTMGRNEDKYRKFVECMLYEVTEAIHFPSEKELLLRSLNASRIGVTFRDEEERRYHYNMVNNLEGTELYPYITKHCYSSEMTCRGCNDPPSPLYF